MDSKKIFDFFRKYQCKTYKKRETIIYPADKNIGAFYIEEGYVRQYAISKEGVELTIHIFKPDTYFPSMQFFSNLKNRYYFEAQTKCRLWEAPKDDMVQFIKSDSQILADFTDRMLNAIDKVSHRVEQLVFGTAYKRTISALLFLAKHFGDKDENDQIIFKEKFTHNEIANIAGITRETASREIDKLRKAGYVDYQNHFFVVKNKKKLTQEMNIQLSSN